MVGGKNVVATWWSLRWVANHSHCLTRGICTLTVWWTGHLGPEIVGYSSKTIKAWLRISSMCSSSYNVYKGCCIKWGGRVVGWAWANGLGSGGYAVLKMTGLWLDLCEWNQVRESFTEQQKRDGPVRVNGKKIQRRQWYREIKRDWWDWSIRSQHWLSGSIAPSSIIIMRMGSKNMSVSNGQNEFKKHILEATCSFN